MRKDAKVLVEREKKNCKRITQNENPEALKTSSIAQRFGRQGPKLGDFVSTRSN